MRSVLLLLLTLSLFPAQSIAKEQGLTQRPSAVTTKTSSLIPAVFQKDKPVMARIATYHKVQRQAPIAQNI